MPEYLLVGAANGTTSLSSVAKGTDEGETLLGRLEPSLVDGPKDVLAAVRGEDPSGSPFSEQVIGGEG